MPILDASALETDAEGAAFLLAVIRWRPSRRAVGARLSPLLGPHTIRFNRGLRAREPARDTGGRDGAEQRLSRPGPVHPFQPSAYRVTIKAERA